MTSAREYCETCGEPLGGCPCAVLRESIVSAALGRDTSPPPEHRDELRDLVGPLVIVAGRRARMHREDDGSFVVVFEGDDVPPVRARGMPSEVLANRGGAYAGSSCSDALSWLVVTRTVYGPEARGREGANERSNRSRFLALVAALGGVAAACSSGSPEPGNQDGGSSSGGSSGSSCAIPCAGQCCDANAICVQDAAGNKSCAVRCTDTMQCPATDPCCDPSFAGGACVPMAMATACRCTTSSQCALGACAPLVDSSQNPIGPYVCKANDGKAYDGCGGNCLGTGHCPNAAGDDCYNVGSNAFCGKGCSIDSDCGDPGIVCCKPATCGNCINSCKGAGVCGPC